MYSVSSAALIAIRTIIPTPWAGMPVNFSCHYTGTYNQTGSFNDFIQTNNPNARVEGLYYPNNASFWIIRIAKLIPYSTITLYFAPVTVAGVALNYSGPATVVLPPTAANTPSPPILSQDPANSSNVVVSWYAPYPPFGLITLYQICINYDVYSPLNFTIVYNGTNTSITSVSLPRSILPTNNVRVRAFTSVGPSSWSDDAVNLLPTSPPVTIPAASSDTGIILAAVLVPVLAVIIIALVIVLLMRHKRKPVDELKFPAPDQWEVSAKRIVLIAKIGEGAFGAVFSAYLRPETSNLSVEMTDQERDASPLVAIKQLKGTTSLSEKVTFIEEAQALKKINTPGHRNVIRLSGCVLQQYPLSIMTELADYGDLRSLLIENRRKSGVEPGINLSLVQLAMFGADIASGMAYLSGLGWVHRDLACRNCLVMSDLCIKIADFGMSKSLGTKNVR